MKKNLKENSTKTIRVCRTLLYNTDKTQEIINREYICFGESNKTNHTAIVKIGKVLHANYKTCHFTVKRYYTEKRFAAI